MKKITKRQREVYDYLLQRSQNGPPPTVREIGAAVGLSSPSSVQSILDVLEEAGYIKRDPLLKRSIQVSGVCESIVHVPLVGQIAAGEPITAEQNIESYVPYTGNYKGELSLFALRVRGESMRDAGILDGDIVVVEHSDVASDRDKVVALVDNEATVKTFFRENGRIRLQPENKDYSPIILDEEEVLIQGKVIGLIRHYN
ncbi:MAG: transcriptional repressor LexA [Acutalibacteraceae bacterium]|jgi:repressor LexA